MQGPAGAPEPAPASALMQPTGGLEAEKAEESREDDEGLNFHIMSGVSGGGVYSDGARCCVLYYFSRIFPPRWLAHDARFIFRMDAQLKPMVRDLLCKRSGSISRGSVGARRDGQRAPGTQKAERAI